ncbi:MAG TPA: MATE family efflux transporter, partial [Caulobacteraceae bacterium]|nr:MATE family efflux transporter [Caulobacteraceae bacterium]
MSRFPWSRVRSLFGLSIPVAGSLVLQNAMGLVSTAMVGRLGDAALAGVGVAGALFSILLALLFGVDTSVQASVARRTGAGEPGEAAQALADGLWLAAALGVPLAIASALAVPPLVGLALHDAAAAREGAAYIAGYSPLLLALAFNMTFAAYWNGVGRPQRATAVNLVQLPVHVLLVWALTFGRLGLPALGAFGAGLAASLGALFATVLHAALALRAARPAHGWLRPPSWRRARTLIAIGVPVSLQQSLQFVAMTLYFAVIGQIGVRAAAAANVTTQVVNLAYFVSSGVGVAAATLVGGALGRGDPADARAWGRQSALAAAAVLAPFSLVLVLAPRLVLSLFINTPQTIETATLPLQIAGASVVVGAVGGVLNFAQRGAGYTGLPASVAFAMTWLV